ERVRSDGNGERSCMIADVDEYYDAQTTIGLPTRKQPDTGRQDELPGRSSPGQQPHDQPQIVPCDVDQVALLHVLPATQPDPAHATAIEDQSETAFHQFGAELEPLPCDPGEQPRSVVVDRPPRLIIAVPTQELITARLGDARLPRAAIKCVQPNARVISLFGDSLAL